YPRETLTAFGITLHNTVADYISLIYMTGYLINVGKLAQPTAQLIGTICLAAFVILIPFTGMLSDRIGRRPQLMVLCVGFVVLGYPFFLLGSSGRADLAFLAQFMMVALLSLYAGSCPARLCGAVPDPRALHRAVDRLQHRSRDLRRLRAVHRDLAHSGK